MRSEQAMYELILQTARNDERVRAVILNGSRANPNAPRDLFQDYDVIYIVTEVESFKQDPAWIKYFGEMLILQLPDDMHDPPPSDGASYAYLMQFADGNRIDLSLYPLVKLDELGKDSLSILLLDKDGLFEPFPPANESDYLPKPPTAKAYADCCNEFWWVCVYAAKGLWREEILYARTMLDQVMREELMKMLTWHIGVKTHFSRNPGKFGKYFKQYLEPELWELLQRTYADASYDHTWEALFAMSKLFRSVAIGIAEHFGFNYPYAGDQRVSAYLEKIRLLPRNAQEID
ncbi:MAG TPA: aminoglycoside 6-adenylyltransferase [Anaerolineales bacterium]|nr:aminoglycoside 6-adenylyltransferase [Anaerolineales bacterium]